MAMPRAMEATAPAERIGKFRWTICGLLFLAATINYIDRQVIGILKPTLQAQFGWTEIDYGDIVFAFQMAYAIGYLFAGRVMDLLGIKRGFALALTIWSLAAMARGRGPALRSGGGVAARRRSASPTRHRSPASSSSASCSASASRATSPRRSRPSPSGSRSGSARLRPGCSTPAPTSAR